MQVMMLLFLKLLMGHALADFALQNPDMARMKNRHNKPDLSKIPPGQKITPCWFYFLTAHALIHGGIVWLLTGLWWLGIFETVMHWATDFAKCENLTDPHQDQLIHVIHKVLWTVVTIYGSQTK